MPTPSYFNIARGVFLPLNCQAIPIDFLNKDVMWIALQEKCLLKVAYCYQSGIYFQQEDTPTYICISVLSTLA